MRARCSQFVGTAQRYPTRSSSSTRALAPKRTAASRNHSTRQQNSSAQHNAAQRARRHHRRAPLRRSALRRVANTALAGFVGRGRTNVVQPPARPLRRASCATCLAHFVDARRAASEPRAFLHASARRHLVGAARAHTRCACAARSWWPVTRHCTSPRSNLPPTSDVTIAARTRPPPTATTAERRSDNGNTTSRTGVHVSVWCTSGVQRSFCDI